MSDYNYENDDFWVSHGGVLRVRQLVPGMGDHLPPHLSPNAAREVAPSPYDSPTRLKLHERPVLLVEDNRDDEILTLCALEKNSVPNPVVVARDGVEALDYLFGRGAHAGRDLSVMPAVILLDLNLPRLDGLEVLKQVRANQLTCLLPVVVLTTSREDRDIEMAYSLGANSYIRKQVDFSRLLETIGQLGLYWLDVNESSGSPLS